MTFKDVAVKNFKAHIRRYMSYFFCSSFSVMIFFMYTTILYNKNLSNSRQVAKESIVAFAVPTVALVFFSIVFISYAHSSFIKSRQQEFGLFMSLGMSVKQVMKLIILENGMVGLGSIAVGLLSGMVFSRLFFLIILKVLQVSGIEFALPYESFLFTLWVFASIFAMAICISLIVAYRFQPVQLLKSKKLSQKNKVSSPSLAMVGIAIVAGSIILLCIAFASAEGMNSSSLLILTAICMGGLYITISQLGGLMLKLAKRKKKVYYKNLRLITGIDYRFKQTKKIIFATTIMMMVTTFFCGFMAYFLSTAEKDSTLNHPFHISYMQLPEKNNLTAEKLNEILQSAETELKEHKILEVMNIKGIIRGREDTLPSKLISVDELNRIGGSSLKVNKGQYIRLDQIPPNSSVKENEFTQGDIGFRVGSDVLNLKFQQEMYQIYFSSFKNFSRDIILMNSEDYEAVKRGTHDRVNVSREEGSADSSISKNMVYIHLLNFKDWRKTMPIFEKLKEEFKTNNRPLTNNPFGFSLGEAKYEEDFFKPVSRIEDYTNQKQSASVILFISGFLGLFFFIAGSVILSFRLFSEIDDDRAKYKQLSNIGIRGCEIRKTINQELGIIFFTPVVIGALMSMLYIFAFTSDGGYHTVPIMYNLLMSFIYLMFQIGYYFIVRKVYCRRIVESL